MKTKKTKDKPEPFNIFACQNCDAEKEMSVEETKQHLREVHGITDMKGNRSVVSHFDCADCYYWNYEWEIGDVKLAQGTCNLREEPWMG